MAFRTKLSAIAAIMVMFVLGSGELLAQQPAAVPAAEDVTEEQLEDFVQAYIAVQEIGHHHHEAVAAATTPEEAQELQESAQAEMAAAVQAQGLTPEEYTAIVEALNSDEDLRVRFSMLVDELMGGAEGY